MSLFAKLVRNRVSNTWSKLSLLRSKLTCAPSILIQVLLPANRHVADRDAHAIMNIRRDRFGRNIIPILQDVADSQFISFDLEFSGVPDRSRDRSRKPSMLEYYPDLREAVQQFQVLQFGMTLVQLDADTGESKESDYGKCAVPNSVQGGYVLKPYNFDISPLTPLRERHFKRVWSMHSGAVSFLQRNGFDFATQMVEGTPYLSRQEEARARSNILAEAQREDMMLKPEDEPLITHVRRAIEGWQARPKVRHMSSEFF